MLKKRTWLLRFLTVVAVFGLQAAAAAEIEISRDAREINICPYLEMLEDPGGELGLLDVLQPGRQPQFKPVRSRQLNLGVTRSTFWFRFQPQFPDPGPISGQAKRQGAEGRWVLEVDRAWLPTLELWVPVNGGVKETERWRKLSAISADQSNRLDLLNRNSIFFMPVDYDNNRPMLLKMASGGPPLNFSMRIVPMHAFRNRMTWDFSIFGIIYGAIGAMILYNAFIFLALRDRTYLFYVLYILATFLYLSLGIGHALAVTGIAPGGKFFLLYWLSGVSFFFAAWFCRAFLMTARYAPLMDNILTGFMAVPVFWMLTALMGFYHLTQVLSSFTGVLFPLTAIAAGAICFIRGFRPAGYFLTAWSVLALGIVLWALRGIGIIPQTTFVNYAFPAAVAVESVLLSLALADRIRVLQNEKQQLEARERRLLVMSNTDGLTKLFNKRYFDKKLKSEIAMSEHLGNPLSLLILDLDDFKKINDTYGHPTGDRVLKRLGKVIRDCVRDDDCACRYGGEEFIVLLPGAGLQKAHEVAERIRHTIAGDIYKVDGGEAFGITVSIGLAEHEPGEEGYQVIKRADNALYCAKRNGKNRVKA